MSTINLPDRLSNKGTCLGYTITVVDQTNSDRQNPQFYYSVSGYGKTISGWDDDSDENVKNTVAFCLKRLNAIRMKPEWEDQLRLFPHSLDVYFESKLYRRGGPNATATVYGNDRERSWMFRIEDYDRLVTDPIFVSPYLTELDQSLVKIPIGSMLIVEGRIIGTPMDWVEAITDFHLDPIFRRYTLRDIAEGLVEINRTELIIDWKYD